MKGGIIGLVGLQGVGKSTALLMIYMAKVIMADKERRDASGKNGANGVDECEVTLFKWRRRSQLFATLLNGTHEASLSFLREYGSKLIERLKPMFPLLSFPEDYPERLNFDWAEKRVGRGVAERLRSSTWVSTLRKKKLILIDMPDYSKTDRRQMVRDLEEIYWLWDSLGLAAKPNLVIAIQKEMFRDHYFLDKMWSVELKPLKAEQMLEAYSKRFKTTEPFTEDALLMLARMSRGIFRRFLRYISLTLVSWESQKARSKLVNEAIVKKAITTERLVEDMELELSKLFPKQGDLGSYQSVQLLLHLQAHGPQGQTQLAEALEIQEYQLTRLLQKLERNRYIKREKKQRQASQTTRSHLRRPASSIRHSISRGAHANNAKASQGDGGGIL
jgi:hypothetical protein